jgi:hypothetical protein
VFKDNNPKNIDKERINLHIIIYINLKKYYTLYIIICEQVIAYANTIKA